MRGSEIMMLRGRSYSANPYTEELMAKQQKQMNREWIDRVLLDILIAAIGFAAGVFYASQFLQRL
jgi:hypothetical protein